MKIIFKLVLFLIIVQPVLCAEEQVIKFSKYFSDEWYAGDRHELLRIAQQRLANNSEDIASLFICFDYSSAFTDVHMFSETVTKLKPMIMKISTPEFLKTKEFVLFNIEHLEKVVANITPEEAAAERHKGDIKNKPLASQRILEILESDGLVAPIVLRDGKAWVEPVGSTPEQPTITNNFIIDGTRSSDSTKQEKVLVDGDASIYRTKDPGTGRGGMFLRENYWMYFGVFYVMFFIFLYRKLRM